MATLRLSIDDLALTRFAVSPMFELASSLRALRDPARAALHLPWVRRALPVAREIGMEGAMALTPPGGAEAGGCYMPDFLTPPPSGPLASFDEELELVRATPPELIDEDLVTLTTCGPGDRSRLQPFFDDPVGEVSRVCDSLEEFWKRALASDWPRVNRVLQADVRYRARRLTEGGPSQLLADLDERIRWHGDRIEVQLNFDEEVDLGGRGLLLLPSVFQATCPALITDPPWQTTLIYPARGVGLLWEPEDAVGDGAVPKLLGATRARLLGVLDAPHSTTDLAAKLEITPGGASQHLAVLRESGLVCSERDGRSVLYFRTQLADQLLAAPAAEEG